MYNKKPVKINVSTLLCGSLMFYAFLHREGGFLERVEEPHAAFTSTSITYADDETDSDRLAMFETQMYSEQLAQGQVKINHILQLNFEIVFIN